MTTAYTLEADDEQLALQQILEQLDTEQLRGRNAVGLLSFHADFIDTGVAQHVSRNLPFDVVGCTTLATSTRGVSDAVVLSVAVLYSDSVRFTTAWAHDVEQDTDASLAGAFAAADRPGERPALIIPFLPLFPQLSAAFVMERMMLACPGVPIFGTVACDHTVSFATSATLLNGEVSHEALALVLLWGDVDPLFMVAPLSPDRAQKYKAVVTEAEGCVIKRVNDLPTGEYLESIGIHAMREIIDGGILPLIIDPQDGSQPVALGLYAYTEEGYAVCGGKVDVSSTLALGKLDKTDILKATTRAAEAILASGRRGGALLFPCGSRYLAMNGEPNREIDAVIETLGDRLPYFFHYGWGELCPVYDSAGAPMNKFHNFTFIACVF